MTYPEYLPTPLKIQHQAKHPGLYHTTIGIRPLHFSATIPCATSS